MRGGDTAGSFVAVLEQRGDKRLLRLGQLLKDRMAFDFFGSQALFTVERGHLWRGDRLLSRRLQLLDSDFLGFHGMSLCLSK
jgi:hypothetical protein